MFSNQTIKLYLILFTLLCIWPSESFGWGVEIQVVNPFNDVLPAYMDGVERRRAVVDLQATTVDPVVQSEELDQVTYEWSVEKAEAVAGTNKIGNKHGLHLLSDDEYNKGSMLDTPEQNTCSVSFGTNETGKLRVTIKVIAKWHYTYSDENGVQQTAVREASDTIALDFYAVRLELVAAPKIWCANSTGAVPVCFRLLGPHEDWDPNDPDWFGVHLTEAAVVVSDADSEDVIIEHHEVVVDTDDLDDAPVGLLPKDQLRDDSTGRPWRNRKNGQVNLYTFLVKWDAIKDMDFTPSSSTADYSHVNGDTHFAGMVRFRLVRASGGGEHEREFFTSESPELDVTPFQWGRSLYPGLGYVDNGPAVILVDKHVDLLELGESYSIDAFSTYNKKSHREPSCYAYLVEEDSQHYGLHYKLKGRMINILGTPPFPWYERKFVANPYGYFYPWALDPPVNISPPNDYFYFQDSFHDNASFVYKPNMWLDPISRYDQLSSKYDQYDHYPENAGNTQYHDGWDQSMFEATNRLWARIRAPGDLPAALTYDSDAGEVYSLQNLSQEKGATVFVYFGKKSVTTDMAGVSWQSPNSHGYGGVVDLRASKCKTELIAFPQAEMEFRIEMYPDSELSSVFGATSDYLGMVAGTTAVIGAFTTPGGTPALVFGVVSGTATVLSSAANAMAKLDWGIEDGSSARAEAWGDLVIQNAWGTNQESSSGNPSFVPKIVAGRIAGRNDAGSYLNSLSNNGTNKNSKVSEITLEFVYEAEATMSWRAFVHASAVATCYHPYSTWYAGEADVRWDFSKADSKTFSIQPHMGSQPSLTQIPNDYLIFPN